MECTAAGGHYNLSSLQELVDATLVTIPSGCDYPDAGGSDAAPRDAGDGGDGPD
jgi:hypothetical protein